MQFDRDNYTPPPVPEGYVQATNGEGEKVWRPEFLEARIQARKLWSKEEFLMFKLNGLWALLEMRPRIAVPALVVIFCVVQRDRTLRRPLKLTADMAERIGQSRHSLYRAALWLESNLSPFVMVERGRGKATQVGLTDAGRELFHPRTRKVK